MQPLISLQYRNAAILKPIHFEPLMATPVIRAQHPGNAAVASQSSYSSAGPHKAIKNLRFPEDNLVKEAYLAAKRYNPNYSYKTLEHFADVQTEIMTREKVDREVRTAAAEPRTHAFRRKHTSLQPLRLGGGTASPTLSRHTPLRKHLALVDDWLV